MTPRKSRRWVYHSLQFSTGLLAVTMALLVGSFGSGSRSHAHESGTPGAVTPALSSGTVSGRIVDSNGNPIAGAVVRLSGTQKRNSITDTNGNYRFDNVETNGAYTVTALRLNHLFNPSSRSFIQPEGTTDASFEGTFFYQDATPIDSAEFFVRQHYVDFLGREPDEDGLNFWTAQMLGCGFDPACFVRRRDNVSAAYFLSIEFQETGGLVDGLYRASYARRATFAEFMPDARTVGNGVVVGHPGWPELLAANKQAFVNAFVNRPAFHAQYDGLSDVAYVDALIGHTGVTFTPSERDALVNGLAAGSLNRADVLRAVAENRRFVDAKRNEAFVMMQYFGYLRRDPDPDGYQFWLNKLNQFNGNFEQAQMVRAFLVSGEFRDRFPR